MQQHDGFHDLLIAALPRLRAHAHALTRNSAAGDDLIYNAVASALAARDSFAPDIHFCAWMHRILYNRFLSDARQRHATADLDQVPDVLLGVDGEQENQPALGELRSAMCGLPPDQRATLLMVTLQGMSYDEVVAVSGCALGAVKSRVARARRHLQALLLGGTANRTSMAQLGFAAPGRSAQVRTGGESA